MKQFFLLSFLIAFGLTACNSQSEGEASSSTEAPAYIFKDIDVNEFKSKMGDENIVILDVRTPGETAEGMIEGAIEIDYRGSEFAEKINQLDKEKTYLVYCKSGGRSGQACQMMKKAGFREFYNLDGGYTAWSSQ